MPGTDNEIGTYRRGLWFEQEQESHCAEQENPDDLYLKWPDQIIQLHRGKHQSEKEPGDGRLPVDIKGAVSYTHLTLPTILLV